MRMRKWLYGLALAGAALAFLLVFSWSSSPLTPTNDGSDAAFFRLVGEGMLEGRLPYRDYFDNKGPWLFFLEALGQWICRGRLGVLLVQWVNWFWVLFLADRLLREASSSLKLRLPGLAGLLCFAALTLQEGNLTEEYALPFLLFSLLLGVRYLKNHSGKPLPLGHGLWYGFAFGFLAFERITNAALVCALVLTLALILIHSRQWKSLLSSGLAFLGGAALAVLPPCLYYLSKGLLGEMLSQVFLFGFSYARESGLGEQIRNALSHFPRLLPLVFPLLALPLGFSREEKKGRWLLLSGVCVFATLCAVLMGNGYYHYYELGLPLIALGLFFLGKTKIRCRQILAAGLALALLVTQAGDFRTLGYRTRLYLTQREQGSYGQDAQALSRLIPEENREEVLCWDLMPDVYVLASLQPCLRYCAWQEHYLSLNPDLAGEIAENGEKIRYLITASGQAVPECLQGWEWDRVQETENFLLWRRVDRETHES